MIVPRSVPGSVQRCTEVRLFYISMNVVRVGTLGQIAWTHCTYPDLLSSPPKIMLAKEIVRSVKFWIFFHRTDQTSSIFYGWEGKIIRKPKNRNKRYPKPWNSFFYNPGGMSPRPLHHPPHSWTPMIWALLTPKQRSNKPKLGSYQDKVVLH